MLHIMRRHPRRRAGQGSLRTGSRQGNLLSRSIAAPSVHPLQPNMQVQTWHGNIAPRRQGPAE